MLVAVMYRGTLAAAKSSTGRAAQTSSFRVSFPKMQLWTAIAQIGHDRVITSDRGASYTLAQYMGIYMWLPMLLMGLMALGAAFGLGIAQGAIGADLFESFNAVNKADFETLGVLGAGFAVLGIGLLLSAISFALARIAGIFRVGGGQVQEAVGSDVQTLAMPWTAWAFLMLMMMGLMIVVAGFIAHVVAAVNIHDAWVNATGPDDAIASKLGRAQTLTTWAGPVARFGVATLFTGIAFMLATIIRILRFQANRLKELADRVRSSA